MDKETLDQLTKILAPGIAAFAKKADVDSEVAKSLVTSQNKGLQSAAAQAYSNIAANRFQNANIFVGWLTLILSPIIFIIKFIFTIISFILYFFAPYIALLVIILLIFGAIRFANRSSGRSARREPSIWDRFKGIFKFSYGTKKVIRKVSGKQNMNGIPRPVLSDGSCDEFEWRSVGGGKCQRTLVPKPIEWALDENNVSDLNDLPETIAGGIVENRETVKIPWIEKDGVYIPQCKAAIYPNDNNSSAGYLFDSEDDKKCVKAVKASKSYTLEYRPKDAPTLDTFASSQSPMCDLSEY